MTISTIGATLTTSAFLFTVSLAAVHASEPQAPPQPRAQTEPRPADTPASAPDANEVTLEGCLAREEAGAQGAARSSGTPTSAAPESFVLTQVTSETESRSSSDSGDDRQTADRPRGAVQGAGARQGTVQGAVERQPGGVAADAASRTGGDSDTGYRLVAAGPDVDLPAHVGRRVEVRGRLAGHSTGAESRPGTRESQDVQGGQMQDVGQAAQADRPRQPSQTGPAGQPHHEGHRAGAATAAAAHAMQQVFTVSAVRTIAGSCAPD